MLTQIEKEVSISTPDASITQAKSRDLLIAELKANEALSEKPRILEEVIIEEVSIDGMCGVY